MNLFEDKGFVEHVYDAKEFDACLLCKKKYKLEPVPALIRKLGSTVMYERLVFKVAGQSQGAITSSNLAPRPS